MLGVPDPGVWLAMGLCLVSALACVVYGVANWNRGDDSDPREAEWGLHEKEIEEEL